MSCTVDLGTIILVNIHKLVKQCKTKKQHDDPDAVPKIDAKNWLKTLEAIEEYLRQFKSTHGVPLSYVI